MTRTLVALALIFVAAPALAADPPAGRWRDAPPLADRELMRLQALGYLAGSVEAPDRSGVVRYEQAAAYNGASFYTSGHEPGALLIDMRGRILHRWHLPFSALGWDSPAPEPDGESTQYWRRAHLLPNGDVLAIFEGLALVKVDRRSRLEWAHVGGEHHDLDVAPDGTIHALARRARRVGDGPDAAVVLEDFILVLDAGGAPLRRLPLVDAVLRSDDAELLARLPADGDRLHANSIELLDGSLAARHPAFRAGNYLVSFRTVDTIAVVNGETGDLEWTARGSWSMQHHPTVVRDGVLLFDNAPGRGWSAVLEVDPASGTETRVYPRDRHAKIFSNTCGTVHRLPDGNTLIVESDAGRALEIGPRGEPVWEYLSPHRAGPDGGLVATLFDLVRLPPSFPIDWRLGANAPEEPQAGSRAGPGRSARSSIDSSTSTSGSSTAARGGAGIQPTPKP